MLDDTVDLAGYDLVWRNKPELPVANEENKKIEKTLKQRKIEVERLKVILENNINKGKNIKEHFNDLCQTLNYKQQLYKSKQHELEMEVHAEKILEREYSRLEQEIKAANQDIKSLKVREKQRETAIAEHTEKKEQLKNIIQWDEDALMQYLEKSAQVEKDNMALLKYTIEDDSKLNELEMNIEKLNKEAYEQKNVLEEVNTEVLIVQTEMDHIQDEFQNAYVERNNLISNWEKVIHQIQQRNKEVNKLSEYIMKLREEEITLRRSIKEQTDLLSVEMSRNRDLEHKIEERDRIATDLRNHIKYASENEKDLKAQLSTVRNVLNNDCQAEIRNLNARIYTIDQLRLKQESEMYEIESKLEKLRRRVKKMYGVTNEEERRKLEKERSSLLIALEEKKGSLNMLTEELKLMRDKIAVSKNHLEANKKLNTELSEKIKFLDFYIANSNKTVKCCISRKQELLVQECLERFQMKKFQKLLNKKNKSVASIQKSKLEFEMMMKERIEELKRCNELLEAEMRTEVDECGIVKKKLLESNDKIMKLQAKYKIILDALGISGSGENAEAEFLIKAENEKRDLEFERDKLMSDALKNEEELSALKNTVWLINATNEQFRQVLHPPGINPEDAEQMKSTETESQTLAIEMHRKQNELKTLEQDAKGKDGQVKEGQNFYGELQDALADRETETELLSGELSALSTKIKRATKNTSRLSLELRNKSPYPGIEEYENSSKKCFITT
ncbi:UNVERIFIED_CONTAM: ccdc39 [Trichonephila clavipes]